MTEAITAGWLERSARSGEVLGSIPRSCTFFDVSLETEEEEKKKQNGPSPANSAAGARLQAPVCKLHYNGRLQRQIGNPSYLFLDQRREEVTGCDGPPGQDNKQPRKT